MTILSVGYTGTVEDDEWARLHPRGGGVQYGVYGALDFTATSGGAGDRAVTVSAGSAYGQGIEDVSDADETVNLSSVPTGTRYDLIVLRRHWANMATTVAIVEGGSTATNLPARQTTPGTVDDQPIALVRVTSGSPTAQIVADLRVWAGQGGAFARDERVKQFLPIGSQVRIGDLLWSAMISGLGVPQWRSTQMVPVYGWLTRPNSQNTPNEQWEELGFPSGSATELSGGVTKSGSALVVPIAGLYRVIARTVFSQETQGRREIWLYVGTRQVPGGWERIAVPSGLAQPLGVTRDVRVSAGDQITARAWHSAQKTLDMTDRNMSIQLLA